MANIGKIYKHGLDRPSTYWDDFLGRAGLKKLWQRCRNAFVSIDNDGSKNNRSIKTLNGHKLYKDDNDPENKADNLLLRIDDTTDYKIMSADDVKNIINTLSPSSVKLVFTADMNTTVKIYFTADSYKNNKPDDTISLTANQETTTTYDRENIYTFVFSNASNITLAKIHGTLLRCAFLFDDCSALTTLDLSSFDTSKVTDMAGMFNNCSALTTLDLSSFDTSKVTDMSQMFCDCFELTSLDLANFDTSNVTNMSHMFCDCFKLTSLDLANFDTSNVTNMQDMFNGCTELTSLDLTNFDTSNVTNMQGMFNLCSALTTIGPVDTAFNWQHKPDTYDDMFADCPATPKPAWFS